MKTGVLSASKPHADSSAPVKIGCAVAGSSSRLMSKVDMRLPIESHVLASLCIRGPKTCDARSCHLWRGPLLLSASPTRVVLVFGGDLDGYNSYAQRGNLPVVEDVCEGGMAIFPAFGRARLLRMWGGIMDMSMDGSPIIDRTHIDGLYFNGGWCYGGFKATPASAIALRICWPRMSRTPTATAYRFDRFEKGLMIDEKGMGNQPNLH